MFIKKIMTHDKTHNQNTYLFFFQAEDGIRDRNVTGVQTCALPISDHLVLVLGGPALGRLDQLRPVPHPPAVPEHPVEPGEERSEERRVGKESTARWVENC